MAEDTSEASAETGSRERRLTQAAESLGSIRIDRMRIALWVAALVAISALVYVGWRYVGTLAVAMFVYYVTRPVFRRIHTRIASRTLAVGVTLVVAALPLLAIVGWAVAILVNALNDQLNSDAFADVAAVTQPYLDIAGVVADVGATVEAAIADPTTLSDLELGPIVGDILGSLAAWLGVAFNVGIHAFIVLIVVFYLLKDDYRIARWARTSFVADDSVLDTYFRTVDTDLHNVYFGNILNALLTGVLAAVVYTLLNLVAPTTTVIPQAAFLGLLVGAASLVPVIGIKIVTWPVGGYLLVRAAWFDPQAVWFPILFLAVSFVVVDYIPDQLLRPYVSGRTLHVGSVMLAYTLGPLLFGWYGIFLAPLLFVLLFEFGRILFPWLLDPEANVVDSPAVGPTVDAVAVQADDAGTESTDDPDPPTDPAFGASNADIDTVEERLTDAGEESSS
ncbi:AI-2E family transporter [Halobaculum limi]|uniref:AI-2E family transporter n=1 Tax=Halobaculum limi TaxID=3031916 RepID=UPI002405ACD4|nr:AI-2E family transporter [Halobaculum sp. YSMS11]